MSTLEEPDTLSKISLPEPTQAATRQTRAAKRPQLPSNMKQFLAALAFFAALLGAWEYTARHSGASSLLLPAPTAVWQYIVGAAKDGTLSEATLVTMKRLFLGYAVGIGIGIPLGMLLARFKFLHNTVGTLALGLQTLPSVCWVPLALLWYGQTEKAMLFIVVMGTVWAVILATEHGIRQIPPLYREAAATMGSKGLHLWLRVLAPASLPHIVSGTKQGWAFAWRSLMAAEIYITILSGMGIGHLLHYGRELHAMDQVVGLMVIIIVIGFLADKIIFSPWERFLRRRWGLLNS
jgi:NitT/TauT family transport system permease protein